MAGQVNIGVNLDFTAQNLTQIQKQLDSTINAIEKNGVKLGLSPETISQMKAEVSKLADSITKNFNNTTRKINFDKVRIDLENAGVSAAGLAAKLQTVGVNGQSAFNSITKSAYTFEAKIKNTESLIYKFSQTLNNTIRWNISSSIVNRFVGEFERAVYFAKDLDKSLNDIRIVSGASKDEMAEFAIEANKAAKILRTSTVEYTDAALVYFQQGLEADDVRKMTEATVMGANIAGESTEEMSNLLTSTMNGYKMAADQALEVTDKLSAVGAATAADFYELATGMSKVASMANAAGIDIDKLNAQLATIVSVTKEAPESIGTSLKTIYGRMLAFQNNATDLMEDEDGELFGAPSVESALEKFSKATNTQISLFETTKDGTKVMRNLGEVIEEIGDAWQKTDNQAVKFGLSTALAGSRQQNRLVALFDSWDDYKEAVTVSLNAEGTTLQQNEIYMESYAAHAKELQATIESLYSELFNSDDMIAIVDILNELIKGLTTIVDLLGGLPGILGVIGGLMTKTIGSKQISNLASFLVNKKITTSFENSGNAGISKNGEFSSDYRKDETEYKNKLQTISNVYKGEDFETVRKMTEELLKQKKEIEEVRASASLLEEAYKNTVAELYEVNSKDIFKELKADTDGEVAATERLNKKLEEFKNKYSENFTDEVEQEFKNLQRAIKEDSITIKEFTVYFDKLISVMANAKAQKDLGLNTNFDELEQELKRLETAYADNKETLDGTLNPMEQTAAKVSKIRDTVSQTIPVMTTFFSVLGDESKNAGQKALSVFSAIGFSLVGSTEEITKNTAAKLKNIWATTESTQVNIKLGKSLKVVGKEIWSTMSATLAISAAMIAATLIIQGIIKVLDEVVVTQKKLKERAEESAQALSDTQNKISELESSVENLNEQIKNLDPIVDAEELDNLQRQLTLSQAQLAVEKELEIIRKRQAQQDAVDSAIVSQGGTVTYGEGGEVETTLVQRKIENALTEREQIKAIMDGLQEDMANATGKELEDLTKKYEQEEKIYNTLTKKITTYVTELNDALSGIDIEAVDNETTRKILESLFTTLNRTTFDLDSSGVLKQLISEEDLNNLIAGNAEAADVVENYAEAFGEYGVSVEEAITYLDAFVQSQIQEQQVLNNSKGKYDRAINNINSLSQAYKNGEIGVDEYTAGIYKNLEIIAKTGVFDSGSSIRTYMEDISSAIGDLNNQYKEGTITYEEYTESAKEQVRQLLKLKEIFPALSDAIDIILDKNFGQDGLTWLEGLLETDTALDAWKETEDAISAVTSQMESLAKVQDLVQNGFKISTQDMLQLASTYPQLLEGMQQIGENEILLNEQVYNDFMEKEQNKMEAAINSRITQLKAAKAQAQANEQLATAMIEQFDAAVEGGATAGEAQAQVMSALQTLVNDLNTTTGEVTTDMSNNLSLAFSNAATAAFQNGSSVLETLDAWGLAAAADAEQVGNIMDGKVTYTGLPKQVGATGTGALPFTPQNTASKNNNDNYALESGYFRKIAEENKTAQNWRNNLQKIKEGFAEEISKYDAQIGVLENLLNTNLISGSSSGGGSGGKTTEEYIVELDAYKKALQALAEVQREIAEVETKLDAAETSKEKFELLKQKIQLYDKEREALTNLIEARKQAIISNIEKLQAQGFQIEYDPEQHRLEIQNEEHVNELRGKTVEETNNLRKEIEELIKVTEDLNEANQENSDSWIKNYYEQKELLQERLETELDMIKENLENERRVRDVNISDIENSYDEMVQALKRAYNEGIISSENFWDRIEEIGKEKISAIKKDIENLISHAKLVGKITPEEEASYWVSYRNQINQMMTLGQIGDYDDYISELQDAYEKIDESLKKVYNDSIENQQYAIEALARTSGTEEKQIAIYRKMMQETYNEAQRLRAKNYEANKDVIQDLEKTWYDFYEKIIALQKQVLESQKTNKESVVNAVVSVIDDKIQELEDQKEALSSLGELDDILLDLKSDLLSADEDDKALIQEKIDYLEEQRDIYASLTDVEEKRLKMQEIEKALADITLKQLERKVELAKNNLVQRVWYEDKGWVWEADPKAVSDAQKDLEDYRRNEAQNDLDKQIDELEKYKEKWENIVDDHQTEQDKLKALEELGANWEEKILNKRLDVLENFKENYIDVLKQLNNLAEKEMEQMPDYTVGKGSDDIYGEKKSERFYDLEARFYGYDGKGYNASIDYMQAIIDAKKRNASVEEILELKRLRNLKIRGEKLTQYYDQLEDFTEEEKKLLQEQSKNVDENTNNIKKSFDSAFNLDENRENHKKNLDQMLEDEKKYYEESKKLAENNKKEEQKQQELIEKIEEEAKNNKNNKRDYIDDLIDKALEEEKDIIDKMDPESKANLDRQLEEIRNKYKNSSSGSSKGSSSGGGGSSGKGSSNTGGKNTDGSWTASNVNGGGSYKIGSEKGKDFISNAKPGDKLTSKDTSDGSSWTKNKDGSTTIRDKNGNTYTVGYASGGVNDFTGPAVLHGRPQSVETVFNATDGKKLYDFIHNTDNLFTKLIPNIKEVSTLAFMPFPSVNKMPEKQNVMNDNSKNTTFSNCRFEIQSNANSFDALVSDMEIKIRNR